MSWIQSKTAYKRIFRIRKENNLFKWYYMRSFIASVLSIMDGIIETITLNYVISGMAIAWLCMTPDHFFYKSYLKRISEEMEEEEDYYCEDSEE